MLIQIHKGTLVNPGCVKRIEGENDKKFVIMYGEKFLTGKTYRKNILNRLNIK